MSEPEKQAPVGLRFDEIKHCDNCGRGILHNNAFFYENIVRRHVSDRMDLSKRQGTIPNDEIVSKVVSIHQSLICTDCWAEGQGEPPEPKPLIELIH